VERECLLKYQEDRMKIGTMAVAAFLAAAVCLGTGNAMAQEKGKRDKVQIENADGIGEVLQKYVGKRVTIRLASGEELTGMVGKVTGKLAYLTEIWVRTQSKSYYDSVIALDSISSVDIRVREE
jgi:hypothetical protein